MNGMFAKTCEIEHIGYHEMSIIFQIMPVF